MSTTTVVPTELWLFTTAFPYGSGESYLEQELPVLAERFRRVVVVPLNERGLLRALPPNVDVLHWPTDPGRPASVGSMLRRPGLFLQLLRGARGPGPRPMPWRDAFSLARQVLARVDVLRARLLADRAPDDVLLYAYWMFDQAAMVAAMHALDARWRAVARVHGFDLYPERSPWGHFPFRAFTLQHLQRIFTSSAAGLKVMQQRHPELAGRFFLARLGTTDHGAGPWEPAPALRVVSCSNLIPLKRVDLLIEALRLTTTAVEWTHYGGGPEQERLRALSATLPPHVQCQWKGAVANREVLKHYRTQPVDLFVHLSSTEGGVPVALQEAASFGIPLLAADVGGVGEIVGPTTGILLPSEPSATQVATELDRFRQGPFATSEARLQVREQWSASYQGPANFGHFCDLLLGA